MFDRILNSLKKLETITCDFSFPSEVEELQNLDDSLKETLTYLLPTFFDFIEEVDFQNPLFFEHFKNIHVQWQKLIEYIRVIQYADDNNFGLKEELLQLNKRLRSKFRIFDESDFKLPSKTHFNIKFIKDEQKRNDTRLLAYRDENNVSLKNVNINYMKKLPNDFAIYSFDNDLIKQEIDNANKIYQKYADLGLSEMAECVKKDIEKWKNSFKDYFGFKQISMRDVVYIMSKQQNPYWEKQFDSEHHIWVEKTSDEHVHGMGVFVPVAKRKFAKDESFVWKKTKDLIEILDSFPENNKRPIFDHYFAVFLKPILIPNVICCINDEFMKKGLVLLGESQGSCYFISKII